MTYTSINIRNSKFLLICGMALAVGIDALITILLSIGGYSFKFIAFPAALLLIDVVYLLVGSTATNYRFKYSIAVWLLYVVFTCIASVIGTAILLNVDGTVLTTIALILWVVVHAISIICAIFTALYTSKKVKSVVFTTIITLLLALACAFYAVFLIAKGFFGQGYGLRTLVYDYNASTDSYTVSGILSGNSKKVEIGETFNGKPVTAIDCEVFTDDTVKEYVLHDNFKLLNTQKLANGSFVEKSIFVNSEDAIDFRNKLFECAKTLNFPANILTLANSTLPCNLGEGKGYIAFDYDESAFNACNGNVIPLIIGDKGQRISLSDYGLSQEYINNSDKNDVADLKWSYENCNGYIFNGIVANGNWLDDSLTIGDGVNAKVEFEKVYRIDVQSGNDTKYDLRTKQADFCFDKLDGNSLDYRFIAKSNANTFFNNFNQRQGFSLVWKYGEGSTANNKLTTLENAFEEIDGSTLTLYPEWKLNNPTVELQSNYTITYGENVTFTTNATSPATGVGLSYQWKHSGNSVGNLKDLALTTPSLSDNENGEYVLTVTTVGNNVTSLVSSVEKRVNLNINKKKISFGWDLPAEDNRVYSGTAKTVTATFDNAQLVGGDSIDYNLSGSTSETANCVDAGSYSFSVEIDDVSAKNYQIKDNTRTNSLTITPLTVSVSWSNYAFTYNGLTQTPTASAQGVANDGYKELVTSVYGGQKNAGTHTATASCQDGNYTLTNNTLRYTIAKAALTVTANDCSAVYGYNPAGNGAIYSGFVNGETASVLGGSLAYTFTNSSKNAGIYTESVEISGLSSKNYEISYEFGDLKITQRPINVTWQNATNLVYNAQAKNVTAEITNKVAGDDVNAVVSNGNAVNAGRYTAEVYALSGKEATNYEINGVFTKDYTIAKATVTITPNGVTAVYGDSEKGLTATKSGTIYNNDFTYSLSREAGNTVGNYAIKVNLSGNVANYEVTRNTATYAISKRPVTLNWSGYENLTYNAQPKNVTATLKDVVAGDNVIATVTNGNAVNAGNYTATATIIGTDEKNYKLTGSTIQSYTISPRPVTLNWSGYENLTYNAQPKNVTATLNNVVTGDSLSVIITNGNAVNAGTHTATATLSGTAKNNYTLSENSLDYVIAKAQITLTAQDATSVYGQPIAVLKVNLKGTIYNNEVTYSAKTTANSTSPVGTYPITVEVDVYADYEITVQNAEYTIIKATPTLDGFTDNSFTLSEELVYGITLADITAKLPAQTPEGSWVWTGGSDTVAELGTKTYTVTFTPADSTNYKSVTASVTLTVKAAEEPDIVE